MRRWLIILIGILMGSYYTTLLIIGRQKLAYQIRIDNHSTYNEYHWTPNIQVSTNFKLDSQSKLEFENYFKHRHNPIQFTLISPLDTMGPYKDKYVYVITSSSLLLPYIKVLESENISEYLAVWEMDYVWCFYKWINLTDEMKGIS